MVDIFSALLLSELFLAVSFSAWVTFMCDTQEREGRKDMEPRSEDGQFEEVTVQQLPQVRTPPPILFAF